MKHRPGQRGYISLEALAAFAILTLSLTAIYQVFTNTYSSIGRITHQEEVLAESQSLLSALGVAVPAGPGIRTGVFESGARWTLAIEQIGNRGAENTIDRYWVRLSVVNSRDKTILDLETIILGGGAP